jgi:hypothetical protein
MNPKDIMTDAIHNFHPQYQQYTQYSSGKSCYQHLSCLALWYNMYHMELFDVGSCIMCILLTPFASWLLKSSCIY